MPPKKNPNKTSAKLKDDHELPAKKKPVQMKPKLKTPSIIKVTIAKKKPVEPPKVNGLTANSNAATKLTRGRLSFQRSIELANEVALAQLVKDSAVKLEPETELAVKKGRRGRKKKDLGNVENGLGNVENKLEDDKALENPTDASVSLVTASNFSEAAFEPPQKKKRGRKPQKSLNAEQNLNSEETVKEPVESPQTECSMPKKRKWTQSKITDLKICFLRSSDVQNKKKNTRTVKINNKPRLVRTVMTRGKKNSFEDTPASQCQSPSILDQTTHEPNNTTDIVPKKEENEAEIYKSHSTATCGVQSRKTSVASTSECLSWTKDISNSSSTASITASSSDFVLINNKFPTLRLTNIMPSRFKDAPADNKHQSSTSSESSDDSTKCTSNRTSVIPDVSCHSLNLSTSSISNAKSPLNSQKNNLVNNMNSSIDKLSKVIEKLSSNLKKIDLEVINWIGYPNEDVDLNCNKIKEKIFKILDHETNVIVQCQNLERNLAPIFGKEITVEKKCTKEQTQDEDKFVKPSDIILTKSVCHLKSLSAEKCKATNRSRSLSISQSEKIANCSYDDNGDDDDALSLFAESITGIESSRRNSTMGSPPRVNTDDFEEYIPQPVIPNTSAETITNKVTYNPTKITNDESEPAHSVKTIVCEKQNADSTSIYKDTSEQIDRSNTNSVESFNKFSFPCSPIDKVAICPTTAKINNIPWNRGPCIFAEFRSPQMPRTLIFKGICYFNMVSVCNKLVCRYPHVKPNVADIKVMLGTLNTTQFVHEYILLKNWKSLRVAYGPCFIEECKRRRMTRLLIEIVIDIVAQAYNSQEDMELKLHVLEYSLLYLNNVNLDTIEGLLMFNIRGDLLCDMYMQTIANTQNFSRFKAVFINLAQFIIDHGKIFSLDVATQLLERIAVLPYETSSAQAVVNIIERTEPVIFDNSMMGQFENQLSASNLELYRTLLSIKDRLRVGRLEVRAETVNKYGIAMSKLCATNAEIPRVRDPLGQPSPYATVDKEQPGNNALVYSERDQRYTSPDTTHLDNMGKPPDEPIITRTINFDLSKSYTTPNFSGTNSNESVDEFTQNTSKPPNHFQRWRGRGNYRGPRFFSPSQRGHAHRGHMKRPMDRQVTYGSSPSKFPHRTVPDYRM